MNSVTKFDVERFNGTENFGLWQRRVKDLLVQQGMLKALEKTKPQGLEDQVWLDLQTKAAALIQLCLADDVMYYVMDLSSPVEVWRKLEGRYMSKSLTNKLYLKQKLYGLKMQEGTDLVQHINFFNHTVSDLQRIEVVIEDEDKAMILLCSLPPSYEHLVTTLTWGKDTLKVDEITTALLAHNQRKQNNAEGSQTEALYVKGNQETGRRQGKDGFSKRNPRVRRSVQCYKCQQMGHIRKDCPNRKQQIDERNSNSSQFGNVIQRGDSDCSDGDLLSVSSCKTSDSWILDTGCSFHMTWNKDWFDSYKSGDFGFVYMGNDKACAITGKGQIKIRMYNGVVRTLCDVRHVPELKKNLISLGTLHGNGFGYKTKKDCIAVSKDGLIVMKGERSARNIYTLMGNTVVGGVVVAVTKSDQGNHYREVQALLGLDQCL